MKYRLTACLIVVALVTTACVNKSRTQQGSALSRQLSENPSVVLGRHFSPAAFDALDIFTTDELCDAAYKERRFDTFFACSEAFYRKSKATPVSSIFAFESHEDLIGMHFTCNSDEKVVLHLAREALLHIDLGEYDLARKRAELALQHYQDAKARYTAFVYAYDKARYANVVIFPRDAAHIGEVHRALGLVSALAGDEQKARHHVAEIRRVYKEINKYGSYANALLQTAEAQILIALEDYPAASEILGQSGKASSSDVMSQLNAGGGIPVLLPLGIAAAMVVATSESIHREYIVAKLNLLMGRQDEAEKQYDALLQKEEFLERSGILYQAFHERGLIARHKGDRAGAIEWFKKSIAIIESSRNSLVEETSKIGFAGNKQAVYHDLVQTLIEAGRDVEAFEYAERGKARALVDLLASKKSFGQAANDDKISTALEELDRLEQASLGMVVKADSITGSRSIDQARADLGVSAPETAALVSVTTADAKGVQSLLAPDEALLEYFYEGEGKLYAFVVTREGIKALTLNADGLADEVKAFRAAINDYPKNGWRQYSAKLHDRLIKPLSSNIAGKRHLTVVPHGALHYLPFNALKPQRDRFLIQQHTVRLLPSASVMQFLNKPGKASASLLVFGNPDLKDANLNLPGAEAEAKAIARLWKGSKVVLRQHASETVIKKTAGAFKYLHLASHGQFDADKPLQSRMLLAADAENDGNLTVPEIYDLNLNADMVVLSACQTALGDVKNGDDVVGLNRGFLYAGARSIVGSLWEVPDAPTKSLMVSLYRNLKKTDLRRAMQQAQLTTMKKYPHPLAWAAFQVTGGS